MTRSEFYARMRRGTCPVDVAGTPCPVRPRGGQLMCGPHWRRVPVGLRHEVLATYDAYMNRDGSVGALRDAQQLAVQFVEEACSSRGPRS